MSATESRRSSAQGLALLLVIVGVSLGAAATGIALEKYTASPNSSFLLRTSILVGSGEGCYAAFGTPQTCTTVNFTVPGSIGQLRVVYASLAASPACALECSFIVRGYNPIYFFGDSFASSRAGAGTLASGAGHIDVTEGQTCVAPGFTNCTHIPTWVSITLVDLGPYGPVPGNYTANP